jgi:Glycosyl transferase family 2
MIGRARRLARRGVKVMAVSGELRAPLRRTPITAPQSLAIAESGLRELGTSPTPSSPPDLTPPPTITVGIVVPAHHDSAYLPAALQSICDQTYPHWECVVVDDASHEDIASAVRPFCAADRRFRLLRHAANGGLPAARNTGLRGLDTDVVIFLDADDMLVPTALAHGVGTFERWWHDPAVAAVHGQVLQVPDETRLGDLARWQGRFPRPVVDWSRTSGECPFNVHAAMVRRPIVSGLGGFDESFVNGAEDWDLWFRILRHGYRFEPTGQLVGAYRQRSASMVRQHHEVHLSRGEALLRSAEQWALIDEALVVGLGAAAPSGRARVAHERARRAAGLLGMQVAAERSLCALADSPVFELLDPDGLCEGRRSELVDMAITGVLRGFGISRQMMADLSTDGRTVLAATAEYIVSSIIDRARQRPAVSRDDAFDAARHLSVPTVAICAESAADVTALAPFLAGRTPSFEVAAVDLELISGESGARRAWRTRGIELVPYHRVATAPTVPAVLVAVDPPGPVTRDLIEQCSSAGSEVIVVRPDDRPAPLPCDPVTEANLQVRSLDEARHRLRHRLDDASNPCNVRRTGTGFPALLPPEDGPIDPRSIAGIDALRDRHRGETVVVIGNGPSLNKTDLGLLEGVPTFGVNGIFLARDRLPGPITYYVVEDTSVFRENLAAIKAVDATWKLFPTIYRSSFADDEIDDHTLFFRMNGGFYGRGTGTTCHPRFSTDAKQRLYCGQSVTIINLQLAYWMGFRRVVLIGMDFSYSIPDDAERAGIIITSRSDDPNHFDPRYFGAGKTWKDPQLDRVLASYRLANEMFEADGREIVNATVGGHLELFPRCSLAEAVT